MANLLFISHPEVVIDPAKPVPRWRLSTTGMLRMQHFADSEVPARVSAVWASTEAKAIEGAGILAARFGIGVQVAADLGENDRRSTGFLPAGEFEQVANAFFAEPEVSVRGWERAIDAQQRIRRAVERIVSNHRGDDLAIVAHGAVGTLLLCSCLGIAISRKHDQPHPGHYWTARLPDLRADHGWTSIALMPG